MNKRNENIRYRKADIKDYKKDVSTNGGKIAKRNKKKIRCIPVSDPRSTRPTTPRMWARIVIIFCVMVILYFFSTKAREKRFASVNERNLYRFQNLSCSSSYQQDVARFPQCAPTFCGRFVNDKIIHPHEVDVLLDIAKSIINLAGSSGGVSIFDLYSGALSKGKFFIDIYNFSKAASYFKEEHLFVFKNVKTQIRKAISEQFRINEDSLYLTYPTFISQITNASAKTLHDEYWHPHVDKESYQAFHYTSLLYLTDYGKDFTGGRFIFIDTKDNMTIEPTRGRVSGFTSGSENYHFVEKVTSGVRYALTVSFTCDPKYAITDPQFKPRDGKSTLMRVIVDPESKKGKI